MATESERREREADAPEVALILTLSRDNNAMRCAGSALAAAALRAEDPDPAALEAQLDRGARPSVTEESAREAED